MATSPLWAHFCGLLVAYITFRVLMSSVPQVSTLFIALLADEALTGGTGANETTGLCPFVLMGHLHLTPHQLQCETPSRIYIYRMLKPLTLRIREF